MDEEAEEEEERIAEKEEEEERIAEQ
eukprot:COSAG04_NODE_15369_length_534_cov_0.767816_1_plen_25_part_01